MSGVLDGLASSLPRRSHAYVSHAMGEGTAAAARRLAAAALRRARPSLLPGTPFPHCPPDHGALPGRRRQRHRLCAEPGPCAGGRPRGRRRGLPLGRPGGCAARPCCLHRCCLHLAPLLLRAAGVALCPLLLARCTAPARASQPLQRRPAALACVLAGSPAEGQDAEFILQEYHRCFDSGAAALGGGAPTMEALAQVPRRRGGKLGGAALRPLGPCTCEPQPTPCCIPTCPCASAGCPSCAAQRPLCLSDLRPLPRPGSCGTRPCGAGAPRLGHLHPQRGPSVCQRQGPAGC